MTLQDWADIATVAGILIAVLVLIYTAIQVRMSAKVSKGQFWLRLEEMFSCHDEVHIKLRPGGEWSFPGTGPMTAEEWATVEDYMGLFEHCEIMLQKRLIDWDTFKKIFAYRLRNILANQRIVEAKLVKEKDNWQNFMNLLMKFGIAPPKLS